MTKVSPPTDLNSFLAAVGHICLQWALLEQSLLALIAAAENMPLERTYTRFGTTDMMPRVRMTIRLAEEAKWSPQLINRLKGIRAVLQKEGGKGLAEKRNLFVHGAHKGMNSAGEIELTMVRWARHERSQIVTIVDAAAVANRIAALAKEAHSVLEDYGVWKFGVEGVGAHRVSTVETRALGHFIRRDKIKRAFHLLIGSLRP